MDTITLTTAEVRLAWFIARARYAHNRENGNPANLYGKGDPIDREANSYGAELAFCKYFNVYPDIKTHKAGVEDATLPDGRLVDVKQTWRHDGRLLVKVKDRRGKVDLFALVTGTLPVFKYHGMIEYAKLIREETIDYNLEHPAYACAQDDLK